MIPIQRRMSVHFLESNHISYSKYPGWDDEVDEVDDFLSCAAKITMALLMLMVAAGRPEMSPESHFP